MDNNNENLQELDVTLETGNIAETEETDVTDVSVDMTAMAETPVMDKVPVEADMTCTSGLSDEAVMADVSDDIAATDTDKELPAEDMAEELSAVNERQNMAKEAIQNAINEAEELKNDVLEAKSEFKMNQINSIKFRLIGGFIIPLVLIIVLGVVSYQTASKAIIGNYEEATLSTIIKTADYYNLMFNNVEAVSQEMISYSAAKDYYSKMYKSDITTESEMYNTANKYYQSIKISNDAINNVYIMCNYGKPICTATINSTTLYDDFAASEEAKKIDENKIVWATSRPFLDTLVKTSYGVTLERQFYSNSTKAVGYLILDINEDMILQPITDLDVGEDSIVALVAPDGGEINNSEDGESYFTSEQFFADTLADTENSSGYSYVKDGEELFIYSKLESGFTVCALVPKAVITSQASGILVVTVIVVILAFVIALAIGGVLALGIDTSIHVIMKKIEAVANGDLTTYVRVRRKDEFRILAGSINNMIGKTKEMIENSADISKEVSGCAETVTNNTQVLLEATRNITDAITGIEQGIIQQASDSEDCMNQMDVLAEKINLVADNAEKIAQVADEARNVVQNGLTSIDELNGKAKDTVAVTKDIIEGIESMEEASKKISNIIEAINEIADQTSLLSLNASIEAARAGEAGRGFAVVADEIRKLADQSAESANQIKFIVDDIEHKTRETVNVARKAEDIVASQGEALERTVDVFNSIEEQVGSLASNLFSIKSGMQDIDSAKNATLVSIQSISAVSQETAASVEEVTATAERQLTAVEELNEEANDLSANAEQLIQTISAFKVE